ncbi:MAG: 50S ribosomal protein L3 N(5)-glutamine methyltransferase [Xanthomonadales bacterium]|nr:50S ribosomal protein L3 N(5)-glutamine methyltransferase [Xanthomonadales bacterium]NNL93993.1 50S ribosomal protein L3 N(5)-glutamine methyltransferase [Xanthomonadales bacterium]
MDATALLDHCSNAMQDAGLTFGHGTENATDEAAWLVSAGLGIAPGDGFPEGDVSVDEAQRILSLLERRISSRAPLAYVLGEAWFCGLRFEVNDQVLVPRSPIAELIQSRFEPWLDPETTVEILDLCTGSGALAVATALAMPAARLVASDISAAALQVARKNAQLHEVDKRITFFRSDLFAQLPTQAFDLILSNPPYVSKDVFAALPGEYQAEPELALVSAAGGLEIPLRIMKDAARYLSPQGVLICEVGESAEALHRALPGVALTWIDFDRGGDGVFIMDREQLLVHRSRLETALEAQANVI